MSLMMFLFELNVSAFRYDHLILFEWVNLLQ